MNISHIPSCLFLTDTSYHLVLTLDFSLKVFILLVPRKVHFPHFSNIEKRVLLLSEETLAEKTPINQNFGLFSKSSQLQIPLGTHF